MTWYLDGHRILPDARHLMEEHGTLAVLRLRDLSVRELGNYSCQAENNQGRARDHIELSGNAVFFLPMYCICWEGICKSFFLPHSKSSFPYVFRTPYQRQKASHTTTTTTTTP